MGSLTSPERPVIAGMLADPKRCVPHAWSWLSERDFEEPAHQWVFRVLVSGWEHAGGDFVPSTDYADVWRRQWTLRWGQGDDMGWLVDELLDEGVVTSIPAMFEGYCLKLACVAAGRRVRGLLYRWYAMLTNCVLVQPDGDVAALSIVLALDSDDAGQHAIERTLERIADQGYYLAGQQIPAPDVPMALGVIYQELCEAIAKAPRPERQHAGALPKVGEW